VNLDFEDFQQHLWYCFWQDNMISTHDDDVCSLHVFLAMLHDVPISLQKILDFSIPLQNISTQLQSRLFSQK